MVRRVRSNAQGPERRFPPAKPLSVVVCLLAALMLAAAPARAGARRAKPATPAAEPYRHSLHGSVVAIDGERVTIDRGKVDGLTAGRTDLVFHPLRKRPGETSRSIDSLVILAGGEVESVDADKAAARLTARSQDVQVGDVVAWRAEVDPTLEEDPLFRVAALGVVLNTLEPEKPLYTLGERLADPSPALADAILDRMVAEVKARIPLADKAFKRVDIPGGRFHGIRLSQAFERTTRTDVLDFLTFVDAFPGKYIAQTWTFVEVYATWIINKTPTGEADRAERRARKVLREASDALEAGDLRTAEQRYRAALAIDADSKTAKERLERIEKVEQARRDLRRKPDDHARRYQLLVALGGMRAWPLVVAEALVLEKAKFRLHRVQFWRAMALERLDKVAEAIGLLESIVVPDGEDFWWKQIAQRLEAARERKKLGHAKTLTFEQRMAAAQADEKAGRFEDAQRELLLARLQADTVLVVPSGPLFHLPFGAMERKVGGKKAVADAVRKVDGKARILHFATHGVLGAEAAGSYLAMAQGPLTLDLISGLDFGDTTDLVALSACQTAVSVGETAEEGISIAEAFAFGGVPTLIASLRSVPDDATAALMIRFYRNLREGKFDTMEALRTAQLELIRLEQDGRKPFAHPLHWAAFGLIGDHR